MLQMDLIWLQEGTVPPVPAGLPHQDKIRDCLRCPQVLGVCSMGTGEGAMDTADSPELDSEAELQLLSWVHVCVALCYHGKLRLAKAWLCGRFPRPIAPEKIRVV